MLRLGYFRNPAFGAAIPAVTTVGFGLYGALFVLTQFLQFSLGFTPLQGGVRILPAAVAVVLISPLSGMAVRLIGPKLTMAAGLALIAGGVWQVSGVTVASGYASVVPGMVLIGAGAGLALPTSSGSVIGSVPRANSGVASATNSTAFQFGGALGVAVVGSLLSTRYTSRISNVLAASPGGAHVPPAALAAIKSSLGEALAVANRVPGTAGQTLAHAARGAYDSGMDLGMVAASGVAIAGFLVALIWLPRRGH
jgi:MFS family permease